MLPTFACAVLLLAVSNLRAAEIVKADNTSNLNLSGSWVSGGPPGASDVGRWDSTVTGANSTALGADLGWSGLRVLNPGGLVTISAGNTLTLGSLGIDMSAASQDLTINANLGIGSAQTWSVFGANRTLTFGGAGGAGTATLTKTGNGSLTLDYSSQDVSKLDDTATLTLGGGTLNLSGGTHLEVIGAATIASGASSIKQVGGTSKLQMNAITRNLGGTLDFGIAGIAQTSNANDASGGGGILGGWATIGGTNWAQVTAGGGNQDIVGYPEGGFTTVFGAANNVSLSANASLANAGVGINSLRFTAASTVTVGTSGTFSVTNLGGGILVVGPIAATISSGGTGRTLRGPSGSDLIVHTPDALGSLTCTIVMLDNNGSGLTKSGPGTLTINQSGADNTFTGLTTINGGTLIGGNTGGRKYFAGDLLVNAGGTYQHGTSDNNLNGANVTVNGGNLNLNLRGDACNSLVLANGGQVTGFASGKNLTVTNLATPIDARSGSVDAVLIAPGGLTKTTDGTVVLKRATTIPAITAVQNGSLQVGTTATLTVSNLVLGSGTLSGKLVLGDASGAATATVTNTFAISGTGTANTVVGAHPTSNSVLVLNFGTDTNFDVAVLGGAGANENNVGLTKSGAGILTLNGTGNYNGPTTNNTGTLRPSNVNAIPKGNGKGSVAVTSGTLDLNGLSLGFNGLFGAGAVNSSVVGPITLTLGNGDASGSFAGNLSDSSGVVLLVKIGTGNQAFTGASSYSGSTTISNGLLTLNGTSVIGNGTGVINLSGGALNTSASRTPGTAPVSNPIQLVTDSAITTTSTASTVDLNLSSDSIAGSAGTLTFRNDGADGAADQFEPRLSGAFTFNRPIIIDNGAIGKTRLSSFNTNGTTQTFNGVISGNGSFRRSVSGGSGGVTVFNANNTYTGATAVNAGLLQVNGGIGAGAVTVTAGGTLGGNGHIAGPVDIQNGGAIAPGASIGILTISNALTLAAGSLTLMELNKNAATNDSIGGLTTVSYNGILVLTNLDGTLAIGDSFKLFNATNYSGAFTSISPSTPGPSLAWDTSGLTNNGTIAIIAGSSGVPPISGISVSGGNIILSGTGGVANTSYLVVTSADVTLPMVSWGVLATNSFDNSGNFSFTNAISPGTQQLFYRLRAP